MAQCRRCGQSHDGTLVRTNPRFSRVKGMILDEATPRSPDGRIAFCRGCQRAIHLAGGTIRLLADDLHKAAIAALVERGSQIPQDFSKRTRRFGRGGMKVWRWWDS